MKLSREKPDLPPAEHWNIEETHYHTCPNCNREYTRPFALCIRTVKVWRRDYKGRARFLKRICKFPDGLMCYDCAAKRNLATSKDEYKLNEILDWAKGTILNPEFGEEEDEDEDEEEDEDNV